MNNKHLFKATLKWNKDFTGNKKFIKSHAITIEGKNILEVSAAKAFKGDPSLYNPEDLLLSSLASCHMMSYLYLCSVNNIEVISYTDQAEGVLTTESNGGGKFIEVRLNPAVIIADADQIDLALSLHKKANELCFIANSCNFPVYHNASCSSV